MTWWCASVQMSWFTRRRSTNTSATTSTRPSASSLVRLFALFSSGAGTLLNSKQPSIVVVPLNNLLYSHQILYFYEKTSAKYTFINILCGYLNINIIIIWFEFLSILILVLLFFLPHGNLGYCWHKKVLKMDKQRYLFYFHMLFCN